MKRLLALLTVLALLLSASAVFAEAAPAETAARTTVITPRFATVEEGQELIRNRKLFHAQISEKNLAFLLQKNGGTLEEYIDYAADQVLPFEPEDEAFIRELIAWLQDQLESHGLTLPDPGPITFVKTTGYESSDAAGYSSEGAIFLNQCYFDGPPEEDPEEENLSEEDPGAENHAEENSASEASAGENPEDEDFVWEDLLKEIFVHEIYHCLSHLFPEYREALYALIHFKVLDHDIDLPPEVRKEVIANPDVEHHDSTAVFTVNGEKKECCLIFGTDDVFEEEGDSFFDSCYTGIVPLGESVIYRIEDVPDFWDVIGENTEYTEDPEEIMADNFSFAIVYLEDGYGDFNNPEILEGIVAYLKDGSAE